MWGALTAFTMATRYLQVLLFMGDMGFFYGGYGAFLWGIWGFFSNDGYPLPAVAAVYG